MCCFFVCLYFRAQCFELLCDVQFHFIYALKVEENGDAEERGAEVSCQSIIYNFTSQQTKSFICEVKKDPPNFKPRQFGPTAEGLSLNTVWANACWIPMWLVNIMRLSSDKGDKGTKLHPPTPYTNLGQMALKGCTTISVPMLMTFVLFFPSHVNKTLITLIIFVLRGGIKTSQRSLWT